jgi:hypothetical protein
VKQRGSAAPNAYTVHLHDEIGLVVRWCLIPRVHPAIVLIGTAGLDVGPARQDNCP